MSHIEPPATDTPNEVAEVARSNELDEPPKGAVAEVDEQRTNRIALWRQELIELAHGEGDGPALRDPKALLDALIADVTAAARNPKPPPPTDDNTNSRSLNDLLAERFHEAYERRAALLGYETRAASAKPWAEVPENNKAVMRAVMQELRGQGYLRVPFPGRTVQAQTVVVTRLADRHADLHGRDFAESVSIDVDAGGLATVLRQAADAVTLPQGRYSLTVSEPWDRAAPAEARP